MSITSGVYPVWENAFKINKAGRTEETTDMVTIAEMTSFSVSIDGTTEEWNPFEEEGWIRRLVTGKGFTISVAGKRHIGDEGNDYVAALAWSTGTACNSKFEWDFPSGAKLEFDCVVSVTTPGGGDSTGVEALEFDVLSDGKPTYTPASDV